MNRIRATVKIPREMTSEFTNRLHSLGIEAIEVELVEYETFVRESRLNYDCVFPQMWEEKKDVSYLRFYFEDSDKGRQQSFQLEYDLMQIPLNLCYEWEAKNGTDFMP